MITQDQEDAIIVEATTNGSEILNQVALRSTSRAQDLADLAFAYHVQLTLTMRDADVDDSDRLAMMRILAKLEELGSDVSLRFLEATGRLRKSDG